MPITTKKGDSGETSLCTGERVRKNDIRIQCCGAVDELNASLGVALNYVSNDSVKQILEQIQQDLFTLGAEIACHAEIKTSKEQVEFLEKTIEAVESNLPEQKSFLMPKGTKATTFLHLARTVCRRAERLVVAVPENKNTNQKINPELLRYLNRLGDLLYLLARAENQLT